VISPSPVVEQDILAVVTAISFTYTKTKIAIGSVGISADIVVIRMRVACVIASR
jgi:hypothetical protein